MYYFDLDSVSTPIYQRSIVVGVKEGIEMCTRREVKFSTSDKREGNLDPPGPPWKCLRLVLNVETSGGNEKGEWTPRFHRTIIFTVLGPGGVGRLDEVNNLSERLTMSLPLTPGPRCQRSGPQQRVTDTLIPI